MKTDGRAGGRDVWHRRRGLPDGRLVGLSRAWRLLPGLQGRAAGLQNSQQLGDGAGPFCSRAAFCRYGMLTALIATGIWLIVATYLELPVSTTHAIGAAGRGAEGRGCRRASGGHGPPRALRSGPWRSGRLPRSR